jgi:putative nucleotidyltransferase with HDIG domain
VAIGVLAGALIACVALAAWQTRIDHADSNALIIVLCVAAVVSGWLVVPVSGTASVSALFIVILLAAAFLGPASACGVAILGEFSAALKRRSTRLQVAYNMLGVLAPALAAANLIRAPGSINHDSAGFYLLVAGAGAVFLLVNFAIVALYFQVHEGKRVLTPEVFREFAPPQALNVVLAVAGAAIYVKIGLAGIAFALTAVFAFGYQAQLLERSRHRSQQYVSLSWGVLAGLMRSLNIRDGRAARHAAAVARFSRDIAEAVGMSAEEQELAHTAGLLHDIGHFALSDRVAERGKVLQEEDWLAIQRHPELGAEMLKDLGMYGPVGDIVLAHHERIDGRGYPHGLSEDQIPEIAKMIAVAEVYDTLTASDTYRTRMSSFEALRELRRVAGSQLDSRYVEVLAGLLTGEGTEYRHADAADFDVELAMERRIKQARG